MEKETSPPRSLVGSAAGWALSPLQLLRHVASLAPETPRGSRLKPTSWLDGLRGFAALLVYFHHHQLWVHLAHDQARFFEHGYGHEGQRHFAALPVVRNFFSGGHYAVAVFFVVSGYVLSLRPMSLVHAGNLEGLAESLSSALFRRWVRLFLPVLATTFLWLTSWHAFGLWCRPFEPQPTYLQEVLKWYKEVKQYIFIYKAREVGFPWLYWNLHTWSIPYEFKGSLAIYTVSLGLAMTGRNYRILFTAGLAYYFLFLVDGWYLAMFLSGMLLCDLDMLAASGDLPRIISRMEPAKKYVYSMLFVASLLLGGVPLANSNYEELKKSMGWEYLAALKPEAIRDHKWFFLFWAATFLVAAIPRLPWLRAFFNSRFCQYLGRVSFSLYLMHGPVIWTLGNFAYLLTGWDKGEDDYPYPVYFNKLHLKKGGPLGLEPAFWVPQLVILPATLWISNLVTVLIDEPSVRLAAWLRRKTLTQRQPLVTVEKATALT